MTEVVVGDARDDITLTLSADDVVLLRIALRDAIIYRSYQDAGIQDVHTRAAYVHGNPTSRSGQYSALLSRVSEAADASVLRAARDE